ncbi:MAG: flavin-dependent dehydrogenase [Cyanobacteria bacterium J06641_5]
MNEVFYIEVPTPESATVCTWLQQQWQPAVGEAVATPNGVRVRLAGGELSVFTWSLQRTTYLKAFCWGSATRGAIARLCRQLREQIQAQFPLQYPSLPAFEAKGSIFAALEENYPQTTHFFSKIPNGQFDLERAYWWERRWREQTRNPQAPRQVFGRGANPQGDLEFDIVYIGGALGAIHAAVMAQRGYRVLVVDRLPFGRMNREWNISRQEFQALIRLGLFSAAEFEDLIAREYVDGFNKFFDGNNPDHLRAAILHTPTVLNIALDSDKLLRACGEKLHQAGGEIWDETEFLYAEVGDRGVTVKLQHRQTSEARQTTGRLLIDAMGSASPIAWQLNGKRAFDSICPTVGATIAGGIEPHVWDSTYGDVLFSHGDISRGRQLIWELFPAAGDELTIYLFHYHQVHPDNPGSLLALYEDFFSILPEYRRCNLDDLVWKKATFGYIPGHFSVGGRDRAVAFDRLLALGDAASLQSPLVFTGFGSLVRNLERLTELLDIALKHDLLKAKHLNAIRAYQSNVSVTWLFSKGMMVPTGKTLPPQRVNSMLNTFFGLLAQEPLEVADDFIKDRATWGLFNRLALKAAFQNPLLVPWILEQAGPRDFLRWVGSYFAFGRDALVSWCFRGWLPGWLQRSRPWLEPQAPGLWLWLYCFSFAVQMQAGSNQPAPATGDRAGDRERELQTRD